MEYASLAITEYEKFSSSPSHSSQLMPAIDEVRQVIQMQGQVMQALHSSVLEMGTQFNDSHGKVLSALNRPKNIVRDSAGRIKGVV
jgi:polyhydroxyalkanoate synthesis regulator protein